MKIGMVSTAHAACGIAEYTEMLGLALKELGHDVKVFSDEFIEENLEYISKGRTSAPNELI